MQEMLERICVNGRNFMLRFKYKVICSLILFFVGYFSFGQNNSIDYNYFSIGSKTTGICIGNSNKYNGIRLNFWDKDGYFNKKVSEKVNGINISFSSESNVLNGIQLGLLVTHSKKANGISVASLLNNSDKMNGIAIALISINSDTLNGLFTGWGIGSNNVIKENKVINGCAMGVWVSAEKINGAAITVFNSNSKIQNGFSISIFNKTDELHGIQIGLVNYAGNNSKLLRWLPVINFHL